MSWTIGRSSTFGLNRSGLARRLARELLARMRRVADDELIALLLDRRAAAVQTEERHAVGLRHDLRRVAARRERLAGLPPRAPRCVPATTARCAKTSATSGLAAGSADSKTTRPCGPSSVSSHVAKRARHARPGLPGGAEVGEDLRREFGLLEDGGELVDRLLDAGHPASSCAIGSSPAPSRSASVTVRGWNSASSTVQLRTSSQS